MMSRGLVAAGVAAIVAGVTFALQGFGIVGSCARPADLAASRPSAARAGLADTWTAADARGMRQPAPPPPLPRGQD